MRKRYKLVKYSEWVLEGNRYHCAACGYMRPINAPTNMKYCPECGAQIGIPEFDKLIAYLVANNIPYSVLDRNYGKHHYAHQVIVFDENRGIAWDAICYPGSYGYEDGLLEIAGCLINEDDGDSVAGWLTAKDVIQRIKDYEAKRNN